MRRECGLLNRLLKKRPPEWLFPLLIVWFVHYFFVTFIILANRPQTHVFRPFDSLPFFIFADWDSGAFFNLSRVYDHAAWPPAYPLLLRGLVKIIFHDSAEIFKAALTINIASQIMAVRGLWLYGRIIKLSSGSNFLLPLFVFFFPGHNVYFAAYTESLYLALSVYVFFYSHKEKPLLAGILCGLSSLVRTMGLFLAVALVVETGWRVFIRKRHSWRYFLCASSGLCIFAVWSMLAPKITGQTLSEGQQPWIESLYAPLLAQGKNPHWWLIRYLLFSFNWECLFFWLSTLGAIYCLRRRKILEGLYISIFNATPFIHLYRPFPWTRFVSVLFPAQLPLIKGLEKKPRWRILLLIAYILVTYRVQSRLFNHMLGEP